MARVKYTDEQIRIAAKNSKTLRETCEKLGVNTRGGSVGMISIRMKRLGISRDHFITKGERFRPLKKTADQILILRKAGNRTKTGQLKRALLERGVIYECENCHLTDEWNGHTLVLQIDHRNGNPLDDRKENLRFLCPNCHSQTDNWKSKNRE